MNKELEDKLFSIQPEWFNRTDKMKSLMCWGFTMGDGWYTLIEELLSLAKLALENDRSQNKWRLERGEEITPSPYEPGSFEVIQAKEKFGTLRFYYAGGDKRFEGAVSMAERMSAHLCEVCGNTGSIHGSGWVKTLCDEHAKEDRKRG